MHVFLKNVDLLLMKQGRKRPWLAKESGISLSMINSWYSNNRLYWIDQAFEITKALEVWLYLIFNMHGQLYDTFNYLLEKYYKNIVFT